MRRRSSCVAMLTSSLAWSVACAPHQPPAQPSPASGSAAGTAPPHAPAAGRVLPRASGTPLLFCDAVGLSVELRLDSLVAPGTPFAMGMAELAAGGSNTGTHRDTDEAIYFLSAGGRTFVGALPMSDATGATAAAGTRLHVYGF
jgi:hypothetical protein